ncbi:hypothetical protein Poli38472_006060 [Pythium oligandrum]|uniref:Uncharacterized protein n=1 Tax=Pythium oligandrum TaxID=41045 RepID=A0A8K1CTP4_PYTOL|nr:hypothetical protein Poli38472_006060 [Pythium oligandrum]|eukprot:TMW68592.1 hypothetical protein Poli38472_006060 [Pythium oligandrum]
MRASWTALRAQLDAVVRRQRHVVAGDSEDVVQEKIERYFWPLYKWVEDVIEQTRQDTPAAKRCVCIGLSCVQGGGKTTMTRLLKEMFDSTGKKCAIVSLDDVYLTRAEQVALAEANPTNPLLQHRGNPGTQDMPLLMQFISECKTSSGEIASPRFDKSLHGGRGDRLPVEKWERVKGPLDVLLVEGWCMGFRALESTDGLNENLVPVNDALRDYEELYKALDALVVIRVDSLQWVYKWREEQEQHLREAQKPALSSDQVRDFVDRFMPAYETYLPDLYAAPSNASPSTPTPATQHAPSNLERIPRMVLRIDAARRPSLAHPPEILNTPTKEITG